MIRGYDVFGRKPGIPKKDVEIAQLKQAYNEPCTVRPMSDEDIAKYGPPVNQKANRARTFEHLRKAKREVIE